MIGVIGNYLPRRCGIATFTYDLTEAMVREADRGQRVLLAAMNDCVDGYAYPPQVDIEVQQDSTHEYVRLAHMFNSRCRVVNLQHEFGIFGGPEGDKVLKILDNLRIPLVVTCHTVLGEPTPQQEKVFKRIVDRADKLVVMNCKAIEYLEKIYKARREQIVHICHGIHDMPFVEPPYVKESFGLSGRVLLTFGLLHRNKGLEIMVDAMARVVRSRPDTTYVIAGQTHPAIVREEGEAYRRSLEARAARLGVEKNVLFLDHFADLSDLMRYLSETDIFVAPYLNLDQMTSGALAYAVGAGKATVATPFLHAEELLGGGRGTLVPVGDSNALADAVIDLLENEAAMAEMRRKAYQHTRKMVWQAVAREYLDLFDRTATGAQAHLSLEPRLSVTTEHQAHGL